MLHTALLLHLFNIILLPSLCKKNVIVKVKAVVQKEILSKTELQKWHCCRRSKKIQLMIIVEQEESHMISSNFMASTF